MEFVNDFDDINAFNSNVSVMLGFFLHRTAIQAGPTIEFVVIIACVLLYLNVKND